MKQELIHEYSTLENLRTPIKEPKNTFNVNFIEGAFFEVLGPQQKEYYVTMTDLTTGKILHSATVTNNMWTKSNIKYFVNWEIKAIDTETNEVACLHIFNPKGSRIYIHLDSSAIGDTLAWFPHVDEFRKRWDCEIVVSTFKNDWFESLYPELEFVSPGEVVANIYAMFGIGWFYNEDHTFDSTRVQRDFKGIPLGQTASDILGLPYKEIKPLIDFADLGRPIKEKYVVIAPHGSAHAKYWNHPGGWQTVIDTLNEKGYKVMMITSEPLGDDWHDSKLGGTLKNVIDKTGNKHIRVRMNQLKHAEAFIGVGSGLSWLAWSIGTPVTLISGFSESYTEFKDCERVTTPKGLCNGCFNREWLNPGDWEWCPDHKDTPRHFECTKSITPNMVLKAVDNILHFE